MRWFSGFPTGLHAGTDISGEKSPGEGSFHFAQDRFALHD